MVLYMWLVIVRLGGRALFYLGPALEPDTPGLVLLCLVPLVAVKLASHAAGNHEIALILRGNGIRLCFCRAQIVLRPLEQNNLVAVYGVVSGL
jgi:hypothetical protein